MAATKRQASDLDAIRQAAEDDLYVFIHLVSPYRVLGDVHKELIEWWVNPDTKVNQLALLPRDHQKSAMIAYRVAWELTKDPTLTFLYLSATATLSIKQLSFIKQIFISPIYRRYWPEMVKADEGKRALWNVNEIMVDHPDREKYGVRDASITACGINKVITGLHYNVVVFDDVVVKENSSNIEGRRKLVENYSLVASVATTDSKEWVVGTRYSPNDLYNDMMLMKESFYSADGEIEREVPVYDVFDRVLEDSPDRDGTGTYLWPRCQSPSGKWYGFDINQRARKYAKYLDKAQFYSQYYNDPTDSSNLNVDPSCFQYYNKEAINLKKGQWYIGHNKLNVYAAVDFAYSISSTADYTCIIVVGIDARSNIYILDILRFKTDRPSVIFDNIVRMNSKWFFRKIRAEVNGPQKGIVNQIKEKREETNQYFSIDEFSVNRHMGTKEDRFRAQLYPRYDDKKIWHYRDALTSVLEDEIISTRPAHDDVKDGLLNAIEIAIPPSDTSRDTKESNVVFHSRFGGIAH